MAGDANDKTEDSKNNTEDPKKTPAPTEETRTSRFFEALTAIETHLKQIGETQPKTIGDLNQAVAALRKDAGKGEEFDALKDPEKSFLEVRLVRIEQGLISCADGSTDPKSIMYKKLASNFAIWSQGLLVGAVTLALIVSISKLWNEATKGVSSCGQQSSKSVNGGPKQQEKSPSSAPPAPEKSTPTPAAGPTGADPAAANPPKSTSTQTDLKSAADKTWEVMPSQVTLTTCEAVQLQVPDADSGNVKWPDDVPTGSLSKEGFYTAPSSIAAQQFLRIGATVKAGAQSQPAKVANIVLMPPGGPKEVDVLIMIALMGALGGCLHWISGFVLFVGNREFLRSWIAYYVLMPIEGAALAIIVYMLLRVGILTPTSSNGQTTAALNTIGLYAFAGLTGIYSKQALTSLGDIFNTIFKKVEAKDQSKTDPKSNTKSSS